ncbi:MAG: FAD-binding oxidoreductase [Actinomycetota bacterium]
MIQPDVDNLLRRLPGRSGGPDSQLSHAASSVWFPPARTRRPAAAVRPERSEDLAEAMRWANDVGTPVSVRSGGHSLEGLAVRDGLALIDLSGLDHVELDANGIVRAGPGARVRDVDRVLAAAGLALPIGACPMVGLGGLITGGGFGYFSRSVGVASDSLVAATVVLPDGSIIECDGQQHPDIYWATRGGAGCAGIATEFSIRPIPVSSVVELAIEADWSGFGEIYTAFAEIIRTAPNTLDLILLVRTTGPGRYIDTADVGPPGATPGQPHIAVTGQMLGTRDETLDVLSPLSALGAVTDVRIELVDFEEAARREVPLEFFNDASPPTLRTARVASDFLTAQSPRDHVEAIVDFVDTVQHDAAFGGMGAIFEGANGAVGATPAPATAFAHRGADLLAQWQIGCPDGTTGDDRFDRRADELLASTRERLRHDLTGGRYVNYGNRDDSPESFWGENLPRLTAIAESVDPHHLLHSRLRPHR